MRLLEDHGRYILVASLLLIIGLTLGAATPQRQEPVTDDPLFEGLEPFLEFYKPYNPLTVLFLLAKNSLTAAISFVLGPLFCIVPAGILLFNGYLVGLLGAAIASEYSLTFALSTLVPHGVFEFPALVLASAAGLRLGVAALRKVNSKLQHTEYSLSAEFGKGLRVFVLVVILLAIAAVIETYVTPALIGT